MKRNRDGLCGLGPWLPKDSPGPAGASGLAAHMASGGLASGWGWGSEPPTGCVRSCADAWVVLPRRPDQGWAAAPPGHEGDGGGGGTGMLLSGSSFRTRAAAFAVVLAWVPAGGLLWELRFHAWWLGSFQPQGWRLCMKVSFSGPHPQHILSIAGQQMGRRGQGA